LEAGSVPPSLNFPQLDFVKPSSGFHPVTWERVIETPTWERVIEIPTWESRNKKSFECGRPTVRCKVYYKGEGGGFLQVRAVVSLVSPSCPWFILAPKVLQLCTNHFVLVLYKLMWVSKACQFFLVSSRSSNTPLYPSKVLRVKEHASTPCSSVVFCLKLTFESFKELGAR
jgi:hypothetical protein